MSLDQLGNIGEFVSSVAVVISLIYLAVQIKKNTETERTSTYQSIVSDFGALNQSMASTPELSYMFVQGMEDFHQLNPEEKARISQIFFQCFHYFENMFYQYQKGYLEEEVWSGWKRLMLTYYSRPGFQTWWKARWSVFSEPFSEFLKTETLDQETPSYFDICHADSVRV